MVTILAEARRTETPSSSESSAGALWLGADLLNESTGWQLKPEGLCKDDVCVPLSADKREKFVRGDRVHVSGLWEALGRPVLHDAAESTWVLGEAAEDRARKLESLRAPDFTLPDIDGGLHSLSDFRGRKVFLATWASWWGCQLDLPVWQKLYDELKDDGFTIITVAMESRGVASARGPIRRAKTTYTSLIDPEHRVADLYNMVNVPQAVWINEEGRIVRPTEVPGAAMSFNFNKIRKTRRIYCDAIRDWVKNGDRSEHVFSEEEARAHLPAFTPDIALAHAHFRLGQYLWENGNQEEGARFLQQAVDLNPESWNFFRQMKNLEHILGSGGPAFLKRVRASRKEGKEYYPLPDMTTMAEVSK